MAQIHCQDRVARFEQAEIDRLVHRRTRKRLHIRVFRAEKRLGAITRERLDAVGVFLPAVVAPPWVAFGIFIGEGGAEQRQHLREGVVFRGNEFEA